MGNTAFVFVSNLQFRCLNTVLHYMLFHPALERNASLKNLQFCNCPSVIEYGSTDKNWSQ